MSEILSYHERIKTLESYVNNNIKEIDKKIVKLEADYISVLEELVTVKQNTVESLQVVMENQQDVKWIIKELQEHIKRLEKDLGLNDEPH